MLYPKNADKTLDAALFAKPSREYRGTPFWAWNGKLERAELERQIGIFKQMGFGGFHIHVRTGLETSYLGEEFLEDVQFCIDVAKREDMLVWLYDEDRWPSGTAGGRVTDGKPENARKSLLFTTLPYQPGFPNRNTEPEPGRGQEPMRQDNGILLAVYDILLNPDGTLQSAKRIAAHDDVVGQKWYVYCEHATDDPWFNNHPYADTLKYETVAEFIQTTHEVYRKRFGRLFGSIIPAIFTDEPQFTPKNRLSFADARHDVFLPWTDFLPALYREKYGEDLWDALPELLWELPDKALSLFRWRFQNLVTDLFVSAYCMQIGDWCRTNGIALTGHVMGEPTLESQTQAVGDAMRCYKAFGIPGIDMLCDFREYTTAKQAQSMACQNGSETMLSELYGVTGWEQDFRGYKLQGDWQAALGVTVRVPHLSWMSMHGEAKRDYPASINYQSPWWDRFSIVENHFARLNTVLTRGKNRTRVAVLHPIESFWLLWGPADQTAGRCAQMERQFSELAGILLFGQIDFHYLCEAELERLCPSPSAPLCVGEMEYDVVVVPPICTIRSATLRILECFSESGGDVILLGDCPEYADARPNKGASGLLSISRHVPFSESSILDALDPYRFIDIRLEDGRRANGLLHQLREDGDDLWLFVCNGRNPESPDVDPWGVLQFTLRGTYRVDLYDTMNGNICPIDADTDADSTVFRRKWHMHDSILLRLRRTTEVYHAAHTDTVSQSEAPDVQLNPVHFTLSEPNVLLLDMAEYAIEDEPYRSEEEILRIDNIVRSTLGIPLRRKEIVQPYLTKDNASELRTVRLRFTFDSEICCDGIELAMENPQSAIIIFNGCRVDNTPTGWYVDKAISTITLSHIVKGRNVLEVILPIGPGADLEAMYLLGPFGVRLCGLQRTITKLPDRIGFGDLTRQGFPFYTGNVDYRFDVDVQSDIFEIRVPMYRGGLITLLLDDLDIGDLFCSPYSLKIPACPGRHTITARLYGTRYNGFGQLHHTQGIYFYQSPNSWRSCGDKWCYEYQLKPMGVLKSLELYGARFVDENGASRLTQNAQPNIVDRS